MNLILSLKIKKAAVSVLRKEIGMSALLKLLPALKRRQKLKEPWGGMEIPKERKDIESRELIGEAILLYRELLNIVPDRAEEIVRKVIIESAVTQLSSLVPKLDRAKINLLTLDERREKFCSIINQFPNADWVINKAEDNLYSYSIIRCRLVELINAAGHPELSDAFCAGDGVYFDRYQEDIVFDRPSKIGSGDEICEFNFQIKE